MTREKSGRDWAGPDRFRTKPPSPISFLFPGFTEQASKMGLAEALFAVCQALHTMVSPNDLI